MQKLSYITFVAGDMRDLEGLYKEIGRHKDLNTKDTLQAIEIEVGSSGYIQLTSFLQSRGTKYREQIRKQFLHDELLSAKYLLMDGLADFEYPQPENSYQAACYDMSIACPKCQNGAQQIKPFRLKRLPSERTARRNGLLCINWVLEPIIPEALVARLKQAEVTGAEFWPILNRAGNKELDGWSQLYVKNILPPMSAETICERVKSPEEIEDPWIREMLSKSTDMTWCDCGKLGLIPPKEIYYKKSEMNAFADFNKTHEWRGGGRTTWRMFIVSSRAYSVMRSYCDKIDYLFEPINWI